MSLLRMCPPLSERRPPIRARPPRVRGRTACPFHELAVPFFLTGAAYSRGPPRHFAHWRERRTKVKGRLPLLLSVTALVVALFIPQSIGNAALHAAASPVKRALFAYRAHYAKFAGSASHADRAGRATKA